jgi:hypothetical protein
MADTSDFTTRLPDCLYNPSEDNPFVFFIGAGVSMGAPINYPNFEGLATEIAHHFVIEEPPIAPLDQYLGKIAKKHDIHEFVQTKFDRLFDETLPVHETLIDIFRVAKIPIRIVTTNFDRCFEFALKHLQVEQKDCPVYVAPALHLNADGFKGLAHIHGSVTHHDPKTLLLTQQDFGRAYLNPDWAKCFLLNIFKNYNVVFVGYSHKDAIINYLTLSLYSESTKKRYVLLGIDEEAGQNWNYLGVEQIRYRQVDRGNYDGLLMDLQAWKAHLSLTFSEKKDKTIVIAESYPFNSKNSTSDDRFLKETVFNDEKLTIAFFKNAEKIEWIKWLEDNDYLKAFFTPNKTLTNYEEQLADWISRLILLSDEHYASVLELITRHSMVLPTVLIDCLTRNCTELANNKQFCQLSMFVLRYLSSSSTHSMNNILVKALEKEDYSLALVIVEKMLRPVFENDGWQKTAKIQWSDYQGLTHHYIKDAWGRLEPWQEKIAPSVMAMLLRSVFKIETEGSLWVGSSPFLYSYISRPAIEEHHQNQSDNILVLLTTMLRETLLYLLKHNPDEGSRYLATMENSNIQLLERVAIYAVSEIS